MTMLVALAVDNDEAMMMMIMLLLLLPMIMIAVRIVREEFFHFSVNCGANIQKTPHKC